MSVKSKSLIPIKLVLHPAVEFFKSNRSIHLWVIRNSWKQTLRCKIADYPHSVVCVKKEDFWSQALWNPMRDCSNISENNSVSCFDLSNNNKNSLWLKASLKNFYSLSKHNRGNNTAEWNLAMQKEPGIPCSSCWLEGSIHICSFTGIFQDFVMGLLHLAFHNYPTEKTTSYRRKQNEAFAGASLLE